MDYQLLKINNVTKLCDDRILFNDDSDILDNQWFDFQLHYLCEILKIPIFNKTQCPKLYHEGRLKPKESNFTDLFTRNQIFRELKKKYNSRKVETCELVDIPDSAISDNLSSLENYGFSKTKIYKLFKPALNIDNECVVLPISYFTGKVITTSDIFYTDDKEEKDSVEVTDSEEKMIYNLDDMGDEELDLESPEEYSTNSCLKYGKLTWNRNSCYADSVIFLLFIRMHLYPNSQLSNHLINTNIYDNALNDKRCFSQQADGTSSKISEEETKQRLANIIQEFRNIYNNFTDGTTDNIENLRKLFSECGGSLTKSWNTGDTQDAEEFLLDLLRMLQVKLPNEVKGNANQSKTNVITSYHYAEENPFLGRINKLIRLNGSSNISSFYNADRTPNFNDKIEVRNQDFSDAQILYLQFDDLINKFISSADLTNLIIDESTSVTSSRIYRDPILQKNFGFRNKKILIKSRRTIKVPMSRLLDIKTVVNTAGVTDSGIKSYHMKDKQYALDVNNQYYFKKDTPEIHLPIEELGDRGFRQMLKIEHPELDNKTEDIFIFVKRQTIDIKTGKTVFVNLMVDNIKEIQVESSTYSLSGAVYWKNNHYMSIYRCGDNFYHFDDLSNPNLKNIGNYERMMTFDNNIVQTNATIYHYIRN
tara:strand:- start:460 stop:2403 length:1944 start_codon:yes stop_codon:yes gene_type:complete